MRESINNKTQNASRKKKFSFYINKEIFQQKFNAFIEIDFVIYTINKSMKYFVVNLKIQCRREKLILEILIVKKRL